MPLTSISVISECIWKSKCISETPEVGWRSTKVTNIEFIVDSRVLFHSWLITVICKYLSWSSASDCQGIVQIGSLTTLWHDHIDCIDDYSMPRQKKSILINEHALNREPVPLNLQYNPRIIQYFFPWHRNLQKSMVLQFSNSVMWYVMNTKEN